MPPAFELGQNVKVKNVAGTPRIDYKKEYMSQKIGVVQRVNTFSSQMCLFANSGCRIAKEVPCTRWDLRN